MSATESSEGVRRAVSQGWRVVRIDETHLWNLSRLPPGILQISRVYLYNEASYTYACEMTPSHWLEPIGQSEAEVDPRAGLSQGYAEDSEEYREHVENILHGEETWEGFYMHVSDVKALHSVPVLWEYCPEATKEEEEEAVREYVQGNGLI